MNTHSISAENISLLGRALRPEYMLGFLKACIVLQATSEILDSKEIDRFIELHDSFIASQDLNDSPTGLPVAQVWWTDLDHEPLEELEEALALVPKGSAFLLCSNFEPHARWAACLYQDDNEPTFYESQDAAEKAIAEAHAEGVRQRDAAISDAWKALDSGDKAWEERALSALEDYAVEFSRGPAGVLIDGAPRPLPGFDSVIEILLRDGWQAAVGQAFRCNIDWVNEAGIVTLGGRSFNTNVKPAVEVFRDVPATDAVPREPIVTIGDPGPVSAVLAHGHPGGSQA